MPKPTARYVDLDAAQRELGKEPITVRFSDQEWEIPPSISAGAMFTVMELLGVDGEFTPQQAPTLWRALFGAEALDEMVEAGMSWDQLLHLQGQVLEAYGLTGDPDAEDTKEDGESPSP
jgi:hypothetical protein